MLWTEVCGQWRCGLGGPYALDYTALFMRMERMRLSDEQWADLFHDIRAMEAAALKELQTR